MTLVSMACGLMLAACGSGGGGGSSEGRLQVISFSYPGGGTVLSAPQKLTATTTSGLAATFRSGTPTTCTVAGDMMTLVSTGECLIIADQPGGTTVDGQKWAAADTVSQLFVVQKKPQTMAFTPPVYVSSAAVSEVTLSAVASSGLPVTYAVSTPAACAIEGDKLKLVGKGSCAVSATQAGDVNYLPQTAERFVAVDPLVVADGFKAGSGQGSTNALRTKQDGGVTANPWTRLMGNWEWCDSPPNGEFCFYEVAADGNSLTSSLRWEKATDGWDYAINRIDIFAPGVTSLDEAAKGLQVSTETVVGFSMGLSDELASLGKPVVVQLVLARKAGSDCNVTLSTVVFAPYPPDRGVFSYGVPLGSLAVTDACSESGVSSVSLDDQVRKLPNPRRASSDSDAVAQQKVDAYLAALDAAPMKAARDSATALMKARKTLQVRVRGQDLNDQVKPASATRYVNDITVGGTILIQ